MPSPLRLGEFVATLALAQDNAFGQPLEWQLRSCLLATWICEAAGFDVLRLAARGLTTQAIADRLYISPKTADHHIQHIYDKIGVSTRAAAALWAMQHAVVDPTATTPDMTGRSRAGIEPLRIP